MCCVIVIEYFSCRWDIYNVLLCNLVVLDVVSMRVMYIND